MTDTAPSTNLQWSIGDVVVTRVEESVVNVPWHQIVPGVTSEHLADAQPWIAPYIEGEEKMRLSLHAFVIDADGLTIVVDTCVGVGSPRPLPGDANFADRLAAAVNGGLDAVDIVLCTHLHFDHVGWNTHLVDGERVPTFPNARYLFSRTELDALDADDDHEIRDEAVQPLLDAGLVDLIDTDHQISANVRCVPTPGHTPGHVSVLIESGGDQAVITGDAVHHPIQFADPDLAATRFDWDSEQSTATRRDFIDRFTGTLVLGTHFAEPTSGRIERSADGAVSFR